MPGQQNIRRHFLLTPEYTPSMNALIEATEQIDYEGSTDKFFTLESLFADFVRSGEAQSIVYRELQELRDQPAYVPRGSNGNTMLLADSPKFALTAILLNEGHASSYRVFSAAGDALFGNVGPTPMPIRFHDIPESCNLEVFDKRQCLTPRAITSIEVNDVVRVPARKLVAEYLPSKGTVLLKLTSRYYLPLIWVYDKATGVPELSSSGSLYASRLQATIRLLTELESENEHPNTNSLQSLKALVNHPFHFVRWSAIQGLCNINFDDGRPSLLAAMEDDHPHVSRAAISSVNRLRTQGILT